MIRSLNAIYLDYMATTPLDPRVKAKMLPYLDNTQFFGNASSSTHCFGIHAAQAIEQARLQIADAIHASHQGIVFTSGATEANNLAIMGAALFYQRKGKHLITMQTEHKSVLETFSRLEQDGFKVTYLEPQPDGLLCLKSLEQALQKDTILVSIMHVNNEIGVIQDIASIGTLLKNKGVVFHVDAAQSFGKIEINLSKLDVHLMSFSAHKIYGPKGIGALYISQKPRIRIVPQSHGGKQENGLRAGTLPTHQIVGMGEAFLIAEQERIIEQKRMRHYRDKLWTAFKKMPGVYLNGHSTHRIPQNFNLSFENIRADDLLTALSHLAVSSTSACASALYQPSYVLKALKLSDERIHNAIRLSFGRFTSDAEIDAIIDIMKATIPNLIV